MKTSGSQPSVSRSCAAIRSVSTPLMITITSASGTAPRMAVSRRVMVSRSALSKMDLVMSRAQPPARSAKVTQKSAFDSAFPLR